MEPRRGSAFADLARMDSSARARPHAAARFQREHRAVVSATVSLDIYGSDRVMRRFLHAEGAIDELQAAQPAGYPSPAIDAVDRRFAKSREREVRGDGSHAVSANAERPTRYRGVETYADSVPTSRRFLEWAWKVAAVLAVLSAVTTVLGIVAGARVSSVAFVACVTALFIAEVFVFRARLRR